MRISSNYINGLDKKQSDAIEYALMLAAQNGYPAIVEKLIEASANVNIQDNEYGVTAEDMAIEKAIRKLQKFYKNSVYLH